MPKTERKRRKALVPFYMNGVVIVRVPQGTDPKVAANVVAVSKQMAYDYSDHPTIWGNSKYRRNNWR